MAELSSGLRLNPSSSIPLSNLKRPNPKLSKILWVGQEDVEIKEHLIIDDRQDLQEAVRVHKGHRDGILVDR
jgi:hypothetical protein